MGISAHPPQNGKATLLFATWPLILCRRRPNLPHTFACSTIGPAGLNLRRFAGVSEAGARSRNPERSSRRILTSGFGTGRSRLRGHLDLCITAGPRQIHTFHAEPNVGPKPRPLLLPNNPNPLFPSPY